MKKKSLLCLMAVAALSACDRSGVNASSEQATTDRAAETIEQTASEQVSPGSAAVLVEELKRQATATPTVIDFYATWCGPCKALSPIVESMERKYAGKVRVVRIDVDQRPELARLYQVEAIPTLVFINSSGIRDRSLGLVDQAELDGKFAALAGT